MLGIVAATPAGATVPEEPGLDIDSAKTSPDVMEISEATAVPFIAAENTELLRQKVLMVSGYVQNYNRKLAVQEVSPIAEAIVQYSDRYGIDYRLLTSLIAIESAFRRDAVSSSGAIGMGQLKPDTAKWLGVVNPYDPVDNIAGTARFLGWLVRKYNGNLEYALSAYYQGPGYVDRNGVSPVCMPYLQKVNRALGSLL
jgi:soluble lytic murein transglycosylase-like protein